MAARDTVTRILITAKDEASGVFNSVSGKAKAVAAAIAGYFSFQAFKDFVGIAAEFEKSMSGVQAVTQASGEDMRRLTAVARELGASTSFSASEAAQAMQFLGMAGFDTNQIIAAMPGTLALAKAGNLELGAAADIASNALSGFGLSAGEMATVADTLAAAAASSNTSVTQLGEAMSYAAPISASLGVDIQTAAAAVGALSDAGIQGSRAGTGLAGVLRQLTNVTKAGQGVLDQYGLSLEDVDVKTRGLDAVLKSLAGAGLSAGDVIKLFGAEAGVAGQVLLNMNGRVSELTAELREAEGAAQAMSDVMSNNLDGDLTKLRSALEGLKLSGNSLGGITDNLRVLTQNTTTYIQQAVENLDLLGEALRKSRGDLQGLADDNSIKAFADRSIEYFALVADVARASAFSIGTAFEGVGKTIGAGMAQLAASVRGDFAQVREIGNLWLQDMADINDRVIAFDTERYRSAARMIEQMRSERQEAKALEQAQAELSVSAEGVAEAMDGVATEAENASDKIRALREQYEQYIAVGDTQGAVVILEQIRQLKELAKATEESAESLEEKEQALKDVAAATKALYSAELDLLGTQIATLKAQAKIAEAKGREREASRLLEQAKKLEARQSEIVARAKLEEARAGLASAEANHADMVASGSASEVKLKAAAAAIKVAQAKVRAAEAGLELTRVLKQLNEELEKNKEKTDSTADSNDRLADSIERVNNAGRPSRQGGAIDYIGTARRAGFDIDPDDMDRFIELANGFGARNQSTMRLTAGDSVYSYSRKLNRAYESAAIEAAERLMAEKAGEKTPPLTTRQLGPELPEGRSYQVNVNLGGRRTSVATATDDDAQRLVGILRELESDMARAS